MNSADIPDAERRSYSDLWRRFSAHLHALLCERHGGTPKVALSARELGVGLRVLEQVLYHGLMPSVELAERMVRYLGHGDTFVKAPKVRTLAQKVSRKGWVQHTVWLPKALDETFDRLSLKWGLSPGALRSLALQRFAAHEPPWVAIKQVVREVEAALTAAYLESSPPVKWILEMEPEWAAQVARGPKREYIDPQMPLPHEELLRLQVKGAEEFPPEDEQLEEL